MTARLLLVVPPLLLVACSAAPPPPMAEVKIEAAKPSPSATPGPGKEAALVTVIAVARPDDFALDGDVAEWGSLLPPPPPKPKPSPVPPPKLSGKAGAAVPVPPAPPASPPPPPLPPSHVAIAITSDGAVIAADLAGASRDGVWIGLTFDEPALPPIGYYLRWGEIEPLNCEAAANGEPLDPQYAASCRQMVARHQTFSADYVKRFQRFYRLDGAGLRLLKDDGSLAAIDGARAVAKPGQDRTTIEVTLPPKALPRTLQAPLSRFGMVARAISTALPRNDEPDAWTTLELPVPAGFEPHANLREAAFDLARGHHQVSPFNLSYQPGDGLELEDVGYSAQGTTELAATREILFSKQTTFGDFDIGYVYTATTSVGVLRKGEVIDLSELDGEPKGMAKVGSELHVFSYSQYHGGDSWGETANWSAIAVQPDGKCRTDLVDRSNNTSQWGTVTPTHSPKFDTFGLSGTGPPVSEDAPPVSYEVTWTYNTKEAQYLGKRVELKAARPKKAAAKKNP